MGIKIGIFKIRFHLGYLMGFSLLLQIDWNKSNSKSESAHHHKAHIIVNCPCPCFTAVGGLKLCT